MSAALAAAVARAAGEHVDAITPIAGGDVNRAFRVRLAGGRDLFVKHRHDAPAGMFEAEADGLDWLRGAGALRLPAVVAVGDAPPRFLALEWIDRGAPGPGHDERLGRGLAAVHRAGAPAFGLDRGNFIATIPQHNEAEQTWAAFYGERRLRPLGRTVRDAGLIDAATGGLLDRVAGRLDELSGPPEPPARLHGDLWGGNAIADAGGEPVLIDPAVYGGHREMDLAMMRLFGGFGPRVFAAYEEAFPLAPGHGDRVALCQLWPLLVHVALFGGGYAAQLARALGRYG